MSATQAVREYLEGMKPTPGDSIEKFAQQLFDMQTEIYSAHAGSDLYSSDGRGLYWKNLDAQTQKEWLKSATRQANRVGFDVVEREDKSQMKFGPRGILGIAAIVAASMGQRSKPRTIKLVENPQHTRHLFGDLKDLKGISLEVMDTSAHGDCLCKLPGDVGLIDVDHRDIAERSWEKRDCDCPSAAHCKGFTDGSWLCKKHRQSGVA